MGIPHNIVICYGKPQSQVRIVDTHGYIRFLLFPRKPVTGKQCGGEGLSTIIVHFIGFKELYDSNKKPPVFCAACELGGCVCLLGNTYILSLL